jgi:hypothetical protein
LGIHTVDATFALGDVTACIVLVGAGLTCLSLVQPWGRLLPRVLRHGLAWVGGVFGIVHALLFGVTALLRMGAVLPYPHSTGAGVTVTELRHFDLANVLYFEPWFAIMGALLIGTSVHAGRRRLGEPTTSAPTAWLPTVLLMAGVCAVVAGTFTFQVWLFAGAGPVLVAAGALLLLIGARRGHPAAGPAPHTRRRPDRS